MAHKFDPKKGEIIISGWEKGIAPSPTAGLGDLKCGNISTELGEISVNFARTRQDNAHVTTGTFTVTNGSNVLTYPGAQLKNGTWVLLSASTATGFTSGNYYFVMTDFGVGATSYQLSATFNGSFITPSSSGTLTFNTLNIATPIDYAVEQTTTYDAYRYYILDANGIVWVSGAAGVPGAAGRITPTTIWSAISPGGSSTNTIGNNCTGIAPVYATTNGVINGFYLFGFGDPSGGGGNGIKYIHNPAAGGTWTAFKDTKYSGGFSHRAILANDQVAYFCDGPTIGCIYQPFPGTPFNPAGSQGTDYEFVDPLYYLNPTDAATRIAQIPNGGGVGLVVGGLQNNLYTYPSAKSSAANTGQQTNILWMPEANTQYLLATNNFVLIFCGSKGNVYLTNGSTVVPILSVPDYIPGSANFVQEPYFSWGGAMYLRGRVWFSIQDSTSTHTGNCGGIWSFVPNFGSFPQQDVGVSIHLENRSATGTLNSDAYNGYAPVIFSGQDTQAQGGVNNNVDGAQYVAAWAQGTTSIDFSNTTPYADGSTLIETDFIPVGTLYQKTTFRQIECAFAAKLVAGESVTVNYRTDLEQPFISAGTMINESSNPLAWITDKLAFEQAQTLQLQIILTSTASNPSYCRLLKAYVR